MLHFSKPTFQLQVRLRSKKSQKKALKGHGPVFTIAETSGDKEGHKQNLDVDIPAERIAVSEK